MIHYHGTPIGGVRQFKERFFGGRHALIPWPRPEDIASAAEHCQSFVIDNGSYTLWRGGERLPDWQGYYEFVSAWEKHPAFDWAIIPDVIDGSEKENDRLLSEWPFNRGVPVWHLHESVSRLKLLCAKYDTVAIGSSGQWSSPGSKGWWIRLDEALRSICDEHGRPPCRIHGLRMLDPAIFHRIPLSSADSTNAARNSGSVSRFGSYPAPTKAELACTIARRIEQHNSAATWVPLESQKVLCFMGAEE